MAISVFGFLHRMLNCSKGAFTLLGNLYWSILILAVGGCIGSFLNVVIYRWPSPLI